MGKSQKQIMESATILNLLLVIGFLGIVWLMIYGNLSGNLGFIQDSSAFVNNTINVTFGGATIGNATGRINPILSGLTITNDTAGNVAIANYSIVGGTFYNVTSQYGDQLVNVTGVISYDSVSDVQAEAVISNITIGVGTFFTFSNTFFTITAIVLLITILIGLLAVVLTIVKATKAKGEGGGFAG